MMKMSTWPWAGILVAFPVLGFPTFLYFQYLSHLEDVRARGLSHVSLRQGTQGLYHIDLHSLLETDSTRTISSSESDSSLEGNSGNDEPLVGPPCR
jgi:hypothetical protein